MLRIGLTGGIGAGKSEAARRLAGHGAVLIDADQLAREVVGPGTDGLREVVAEFGDRVLGPTGGLDRAALAAAVFDDVPARRRLEAIIHPRVRTRTAELTAAAPAGAVVVNDVPLLVEAGLAATYHLVIVVEADPVTRVGRLVRDRGMDETQAWSRIRAQASDHTRRAAADVLLRNEGPREELHAAVDALWSDRLRGFADNLRRGEAAPRPGSVQVVPYDPGWPTAYERLAARIRHATGDLRTDHIGSTAVPGLAAKDVIDIQVTVDDLDAVGRLPVALGRAGFPSLPGSWRDHPKPDHVDPADWRKLLHASADPGRPVNLHVRATGSPGWRTALLLRDWLRADRAACAEYVTLKRRLAATHHDPAGYAQAKEPWFDQAWAQARQWADRTHWQP